MRLLYFIIALLTSFHINAQFLEEFSDGNFTNNPTWEGSTTLYIINDALELQNMDTQGGESYLSTPVLTADSTTWEFYFRLEFAPSTSNTMKAYLSSNQSNLLSDLNGYFIKVGASGNTDALELYRQDGTNTTLLLSSPEGSAAENPTIRVRVIRNNDAEWELLADLTGGNDFTSFGTLLDSTYNLGQYFGFANKYTSTRKDKFFFDDISISPLYTDTEPPLLLSATPINNNSIDLLFNESVSATSAEESTNYIFTPNLSVSSANLDSNNPSLVHLSTAPMENGTNYTLSVSNITDLEGNMATNQNTSFLFVETTTASPSDIIFNEIFADPSPVVGLPETEFIELYNRSNDYINLENFTLSDASSSSTPFDSYLLAPNDYLIICASENIAEYTTFGNTLGINNFPSLNNSGDELILRNPDSIVIDSINYSSSWYRDSEKSGGGWTLELKNPNLYCIGSDNWIASNNNQGGSPGSQNSVFDNSEDSTPPSMTASTAISNNAVTINFSETMDQASVNTLSNYTLSPLNISPNNISINTEENQVTLSFNTSFSNEQEYTITTNNVFDCVGNEMTVNNISFTFYQTNPAEPYDIIINEIMAAPSPSHGLPELEYIELYNRSDKNINLENYILDEGSSSGNTLPFFILRPNQFLILQKNNTSNFEDYSATIQLNNFNLTNGGELLELRDPNGNTIDAVQYDDDWYLDGRNAGYSLERISHNQLCSPINNWTSSLDPQGGTPGKNNSVQVSSIQDTTRLEIQKIYLDRILPNQVTITFNQAIAKNSIENLENINITPIDLSINNAYANSPLSNEFTIEFNEDATLGNIYQITLSNIQNCIGDISTPLNGKFAVPDTIAAGDIILNEILHNPYTGGSRFVEIYNKSNKVLDIADLYLAKRTETGTIGYDEAVETACLLFPKGYLVLTSDTKDILSRYQVNNPNALVNTNIPSYDNTADAVLLMTTNSLIVDELNYTKEFHNTLLDDRNGVSLERINPNAATQDLGNWHSAAETAGFATPTYTNSQYANDTPINNEDIISITDKTFSPNGDGYQDILQLSYQLPSQGFLLKANIYDSRGRLIKKLYRQTLLAQTGSLKWDGSTDNAEKAPVGIYVLVAEFTKADGSVIGQKETIVVADDL